MYGDMACAINPLGDLYKTQVRELAKYIGVPEKIVRKKPTADLWMGQTDEEEIGYSYDEIDKLLYCIVDMRYSREDAIKVGFKPDFIDAVTEMIRRSQFKRRLPVIAKISQRTIDRDFRYARDWGM
jgi:NAD+ synthase